MAGRLDALSARDRKLLALLVVFFGVVGTGVLFFAVRGAIDDKASRVRAAKDNHEVLVAMEEAYQDASATISSSQERLAKAGNERLDAFVEKVAVQTSTRDQLHSVDERGTEKTGNIEQTTYEIQLRKVPLPSALDFLYDLENSGYPVSVERATFKTVFVSGERLVNLTLEVVTLSVKEGE